MLAPFLFQAEHRAAQLLLRAQQFATEPKEAKRGNDVDPDIVVNQKDVYRLHGLRSLYVRNSGTRLQSLEDAADQRS